MRVLLSTYGSRGDVEPMAALAVRLRAQGAEAVVCAPPDPEFARLLANAEVPMVPAGAAVRPLVTGTGPPSEGDFAARTAAILADQLDRIITAATGFDAIVATGMFPVAAAARAAADALGLRYHHVSFQPTLLPSLMHRPPERPGRPLPRGVTDNRELWAHDAASMHALYGEPVNRLRAANGLPPWTNVRDRVYTGRPWLAADTVLSPWHPRDFDAVQTGAWILPDDRPLTAELEAFLESGPPPVYIGFGSIPVRPSESIARVAVGAARRHGLRAILASGWAGLAPIDDNDDCIAVEEVNQQALFPRTAAVVHHGGAGTTTAAAIAGTPQVVLPQIVDQPYWARRVAELGIGAAHPGPNLTTASLTAAMATALTAETRDRAAATAATIRPDGASAAATLLTA
ncbi:glycosyltransferase [Glycomyces algeriensis]|uniref:Glycosyl transferase n=1 Tax=Glycomyces algeriensis TaxID=256037 RepID=A0A9W6LIL5_9ACTN|nr:glycosyltransferase [Glycomyces algeriensis]MDA1368351.1 glycosyltransferase [Glycomyces algeriensis]MDR7351793.1 vancomycin aglycone glucosyltransferase [Glycomyces algeriensis]GLI44520.1 glycosyl transferase [Glycomyces algeriensis]